MLIQDIWKEAQKSIFSKSFQVTLMISQVW